MRKNDDDKTVNQRVFGQIRSYMDGASADYYKKKEAMEQRQLQAERLRRQQQQHQQRQLESRRVPPAIEECDED